MLHCMKALVLLQRGVWGYSPRKILENGAILCILDCKWLTVQASTLALKSAPGPLLVRAPGKYPHLPPLSVGLRL